MNKSSHYLFYSRNRENDRIILDARETHHARSVLRLLTGEDITVTDGTGSLFNCTIVSFTDSGCECDITAQKQCPPSVKSTWFFIGIPDKNCFEYALEALAPLGAGKIIPMECDFCQKGWWKEDWEKLSRRFEEKIIIAGKQSYNPWFAVLEKPREFKDALSCVSGLALVADVGGQMLERAMIAQRETIACFIGPPGGFSEREMQCFRERGAVFVKLGAFRLRTELAALTLAAQLAPLVHDNENIKTNP
ncbi:MAG: RsmE family RNA methyltransferase [Chitinivibrionales bacterium]|nr:RsmE family RNA methyltransferase [Chitinivibrionales bacterium]